MIQTKELIDYVRNGWIECREDEYRERGRKNLFFTGEGFKRYFDKLGVWGTQLHHLALSILNECPIDVYEDQGNGSFLIYRYNEFYPKEKTLSFLFMDGNHFEPLFNRNLQASSPKSGKSTSQVKAKSGRSKSASSSGSHRGKKTASEKQSAFEKQPGPTCKPGSTCITRATRSRPSCSCDKQGCHKESTDSSCLCGCNITECQNKPGNY